MPIAWRIVKKRCADIAFDGEAARRNGGRWTSVGRRTVYVSSSAALATLEILVHLGMANRGLLNSSYVLFKADIPEDLVAETDLATLPAGWSAPKASPELTTLGDSWIGAGERPVLRVPSAVISSESNFILDPEHPEFKLISIGPQQPYNFDPRLLL